MSQQIVFFGTPVAARVLENDEEFIVTAIATGVDPDFDFVLSAAYEPGDQPQTHPQVTVGGHIHQPGEVGAIMRNKSGARQQIVPGDMRWAVLQVREDQ